MKHWLLLSAALLCGCASQHTAERRQEQEQHDKFVASLSGWNGRDVSDLILQAGQPTNVATLPNGSQLYTWEKPIVVPGWNGSTNATVCEFRYSVNPTSHLITGHALSGC
jgi:hypothetical protein